MKRLMMLKILFILTLGSSMIGAMTIDFEARKNKTSLQKKANKTGLFKTKKNIKVRNQKKNLEKELLEAAKEGDTKHLKKLIAEGNADINTQDDSGSTPLHAALYRSIDEISENGIPSCVKILLNSGVDVNLADNDGYTPLHCVSYYGNPDCLQALLDAGAIVDSKLDGTQGTPLHVTAIYGNTECLELLLKAGANINGTTSHDITALHLATRKGQIKCIKALIKAGADLTLENEDWDTPRDINPALFDRCMREVEREKRLVPNTKK